MNKLTRKQRKLILTLLVEGSSLRSVSRTVDVSINTVKKLLIDAGTACADFHDKSVRNVRCTTVQAYETWSFCYAKEKHVEYCWDAPDNAGDVWTWTAIDKDSKLILSFYAGGRDYYSAVYFLRDLRDRLDTRKRVKLITDGNPSYVKAAEKVLSATPIDYSQLVKIPDSKRKGRKKKGSKHQVLHIIGRPITPDEEVSTNAVERQNLTMRMSMRRFTRKTNGFSKRFENHCHSIALYFVWYNFCRVHQTLQVTPAMEAGLVNELYDIGFIVDLLEAEEAKRPRTRGPFRKRK